MGVVVLGDGAVVAVGESLLVVGVCVEVLDLDCVDVSVFFCDEGVEVAFFSVEVDAGSEVVVVFFIGVVEVGGGVGGLHEGVAEDGRDRQSEGGVHLEQLQDEVLGGGGDRLGELEVAFGD